MRALKIPTTPHNKNILKPLSIAIILTLLTLSITATAQDTKTPAPYRDKTNPYWNDINAIKQGQTLYNQNCAACHAANGQGNLPNQPDFTDVNWWIQQKDDYLLWRVSEGIPDTKMPAWKTRLSEENIGKILSYAKTFPNQQPTKTQTPQQTPGFTLTTSALLIVAAGLLRKHRKQ